MNDPDLDHPCRDTCSGWKQGYERGQQDHAATIAKLREALRKAILWAESCYSRIPHGAKGNLNFTYLEEARDAGNETEKSGENK